MPEVEIKGLWDLIKFLNQDPKKLAETIGNIVKRKGTDVVDALKKEAIKRLSPLVEIPPLERVHMPKGSDKTYLSQTMAKQVADKLKEYGERLKEIPNGEISDYRDDSLKLIKGLSKELEDYNKCFDVFMFGKQSGWFSKGVNYDQLWQARKFMKLYLMNIKKFFDEYNTNDKYTYEKVRERLEKEVQTDIELATTNLAGFIFKEAWKLVRDYAQKPKSGYYKNEEDMLKAYQKCSSAVQDALQDALTKTKGLKWCDYTTKLFEDINFYAIDGYKTTCRVLASEILNADYQGDPFKFCGLKATGSFLGDLTPNLKKCVEYTQNQLNKVINLGENKAGMYNQDSSVKQFTASDLGVNLKTLIGDDYVQNREKWEPQTKILKTAVVKDLYKKMESLHSQVDKKYKEIKSYQKKFFPAEASRPGQGELHHNFAALIVTLPSATEQNEEKTYKIEDNYSKLAGYYTDAKRNIQQTTKDDFVSLYVRKAEKFLKACAKWNEDRIEYVNWLKNRDIAAADWIKKVKNHYKELCKKGENINKGQKRQRQEVHKEWKKILDKAYKLMPSSVRNFVKDKDYDPNVRMAEAFLLLDINQWGATSRIGRTRGVHYDRGSKLTTYFGADETNVTLLLGENTVVSYLGSIKTDPNKIVLVKQCAEVAKANPWRPVPPASPPPAGGPPA